jgi:hypothetical protein
MTKVVVLTPQGNHLGWFALARVTSKYHTNSEILAESAVGNF